MEKKESQTCWTTLIKNWFLTPAETISQLSAGDDGQQ